jgi:hypothetical protein
MEVLISQEPEQAGEMQPLLGTELKKKKTCQLYILVSLAFIISVGVLTTFYSTVSISKTEFISGDSNSAILSYFPSDFKKAYLGFNSLVFNQLEQVGFHQSSQIKASYNGTFTLEKGVYYLRGTSLLVWKNLEEPDVLLCNANLLAAGQSVIITVDGSGYTNGSYSIPYFKTPSVVETILAISSTTVVTLQHQVLHFDDNVYSGSDEMPEASFAHFFISELTGLSAQSHGVFSFYASEDIPVTHGDFNDRTFNRIDALVGSDISLDSDGRLVRLQPGTYMVNAFSLVSFWQKGNTLPATVTTGFAGYLQLRLQDDTSLGCGNIASASSLVPSWLHTVLTIEEPDAIYLTHQVSESLFTSSCPLFRIFRTPSK